ncbi:hypothetical protein QMK19_34520 [Streptomyces sp. H10-C2]|uniref:hypothetical protein n=1 Tax=unclassified Streptomyces TaxID=2593676 RepID=UPI0024BAF6E3|nr:MULTISPECIES: hypothetical protein [unclassified Streptomyces]MDJ0346694.1 hypothetical protein [Streptomyces sp. PH10-H1]MDJ0374602.1 hypothetical protein [Streptomyces sp. H10-C2]
MNDMDPFDPYAEMTAALTRAQERFAADVDGAKMAVLMDNGLYRHLRFDFPRASWQQCEIVTWPGTLVIHGGTGHWAFSRQDDMFSLFRPSPPRRGSTRSTGPSSCPMAGEAARCSSPANASAPTSARKWSRPAPTIPT